MIALDGRQIWVGLAGKPSQRPPLVCVPGGPGTSHHYLRGLETRAAMPEILASLMRPGQTLHAIRESSTWHGVREDVRRLLAGRSIDLLVIDGDHSYGGVRSDFEMYAGLVAPGGLVAFHDVMVRPENSGRGLDVGVYWQELAREHRTETIADPKGVPGVSSQRNLPFEARRPAALGWGLLFVV